MSVPFYFAFFLLMAINLQEFIEGYKTSEVILKDKRRTFREPRIIDLSKPVLELLQIGCIEGEWSDFLSILENELTASKQKEVIEQILQDLGLA